LTGLSRTELVARVEETLADLTKFSQRYVGELDDIVGYQQMLEKSTTLVDPAKMMAVVAWRSKTEEEGIVEYRYKHVPLLRALRDELVRRGASLPNEARALRAANAAEFCLSGESVPDQEQMTGLADYLRILERALKS